MSRGINKVTLIGNAGNPPETRYTPSGAAITNVSIATSESWRNKQTGQLETNTEWHRLVFADRGNYKMGQMAGDWIKKGSKVYVEGKLRTREWEKDGIKRYTTEIVVSEFQILDPMPENQNQQPQQQPSSQGGYGQPQSQQPQPPAQPQSFGTWGGNQPNGYAQAQNQPPQQQRPPAQSQQPPPPDFDSDIPF